MKIVFLVLFMLSLSGCQTARVGQDIQPGPNGVYVSATTGERFTGDAIVSKPPKEDILSHRCGNVPMKLRIENGVVIAKKWSRSIWEEWKLEPITGDDGDRQ